MNVTLRQLRIFEAVARHLSFTRASEELHLTQPAVSMQIKQLEQAVGLPLLDQQGKKTYLTEAGEEMYRYACAVTDKLEEAAQVFEELKGMRRGHMSIAVASTANYFAPRLLATFFQRYPDVTVSLDVTNREGLLRALAENETDLVIMGKPPEDMDLVAENFMDNPLVVIAPTNHPLTRKRSRIPFAALASETFLIRERGSGTRSAMERHFAQHGLELSSTMEMGTSEAIKQGVEAGLGLGLLSLHTLEMELALKRVAILDVETFPIMRHWYVVHRRGKRLSTAAQAFKHFLLKEARNLLSLPEVSRPRHKDAG
ncbi:transcriptional regulator [Thiohalobacter sp. COW1]|uniref:Transcriptional regulator n=1 Tax=Thiohalobacter thiocyanaticus TaxID=585455 RepID=A0A1Z4VNU9_9GAMM|nr:MULTISPECIES: LysR family transcriptional regulator [Thiohalobacter]BAZ92904.1 transcriptional regulator [Thiohalobacter thiocyanaticus]BCO32135.1 transcriptional regulator [Thiohalobacter sp. COW1]